jgi:hypothetical protein
MTSNIDVKVPVFGNPRTEDERKNWQIASSEISNLQQHVENLELGAYVLPIASLLTLGGIRSDGVSIVVEPGTGIARVPPTGIIGSLGYTPYDAANPAHYQTDLQVTASLDARLSIIPPQMDGTVSPGSSSSYAREDHIHPTDGSRYAASNPANYQSDMQVAATLAALLGSNLPVMDGIALVGIATAYSREDHVHPTDTSRYAAANPAHYQSDTQVSSAIGAAVASYVPLTQRGSANGVPTLDGAGKIPTGQLPAAATGTVQYIGTWNPSTNTPTAASGALMGGVLQAAGRYWVASVAGTTAAIDGITSWAANDWIISNGTTWEKVQTAATPYLPVSGGILSLPGTISGIGGLTFTTNEYIGPPASLVIDTAEVWLDSTNSIAVQISSQGILYAASLIASQASITNAAVTLLADPVNPLDAATKQYFDNLRSNTLPAMAATATAGTALTVSRSDHVHPTDQSRAPLVAPVFTGSVTMGSDIWMPSLEPDLAISWRDQNGNMAGWIDWTGAMSVATLYAANLSAGALSGLQSITAVTGTFTVANLSTETVQDEVYPDLVGAVRGANGNYIFGFDSATGETNVVSLNAQNGLKVGGTPLNLVPQTAPTDALDVRSAPYNAVGDGVSNHGYVTTSANLLTVVNFTGAITLTAVDANTTRVQTTADRATGWAFQPKHTGKLCYIDFGGGVTLLARVLRYDGGTNILLDTTGQTVPNLTSVPGNLTLPAVDMTASIVGKVLIVEGMGQDSYYSQSPIVTRKYDLVTPYGTHNFMATIAAFPAPNQIQITPVFPFNWNGTPTRILWGTNDSVASINCAIDAWPSKRRIWFSGDRLYLLPNAGQDNAGHPNYINYASGNAGPLFNGVIWGGDNAEVYVACNSGRRMPHRVSPIWAPRYNDVPKLCHGKMSFPRCAQIPMGQTINILFDGDSLSAFDPQIQVQLVMGAERALAEIIAQNPGRKFAFYNIGVGGATWETMADSRGAYNSSSGGAYKYAVIPKPIAGTIGRTAFWTNVNRTATSATNPIVPDLFVSFLCAGNDKMSVSGAAMHSIINQIRNIPHADAYGPTDIIMQTDHHATMGVCYTNGVWDGVPPPGWAAATLDEYYNMGINRTTAQNMGIAFLDFMPLENRQAFGYDPTRRGMRQVPQVTLNPTPAAPVALAEECLDFAFWIYLPGASDAAAWTALQQLEIQLSKNPGNRLFLRRGPNGNIWMASSTYGLAVDTVVSVSAGQKTIQLGTAPAITGANVSVNGAWPQAYCIDGSLVWTSAMTNQCIVWNTGNMGAGAFGRLPQRNYIRTVLTTMDVLLHEVPHDNNDISPIAGPISLGPNQFIAQDATAQPDVVIFYPDGTIWNTQVAYGSTITPTSATLVDAAPQSLVGQTVPMFLGRMGLKWFDTGLTPSATSNTGAFALSVIRGEVAMGYAVDRGADIPMHSIQRTLERFGGLNSPVIYVKGAQQIQLSNRWIDDDVPIAASTPAWYQRGLITTNSDITWGGTGGHYGAAMRASVLDTMFAHQNLSVN